MKQERVDLWSAASFAAAPAAVTADHLPAGTARFVAPRLAGRLTGAAPDEAEAEAVEILATAEGRLRAQDLDGLAGEVLLPDPALLDALLATDDAGRQRAGIEAYNAWAATLQAKAPHRLVAVAQIPTTGLDDALEALGAAQAAGVRAVSLVPAAGRRRHDAGRRRRVLAAGRRPHRRRARAGVGRRRRSPAAPRPRSPPAARRRTSPCSPASPSPASGTTSRTCGW